MIYRYIILTHSYFLENHIWFFGAYLIMQKFLFDKIDVLSFFRSLKH